MVGLPEDENVGKLIRWIEASNRYLVAVCHGPAAMVATAVHNNNPHPYQGYKMVAFPDKYDKQSPSMGYLPGHLAGFSAKPWKSKESKSSMIR
ncbi:hypothetical protein D5R40_27835 [Okeania hirsuta]|uniref:DJ-1/PfpI domain-containing protein n=1 Tax=Okeania hirsuta TaxID=1458930 RepID=A0A3N6P4K8_9CYAN|nr:hypothetical protein D5R40_27835 [Okeania hirsuta]